MKISINDIDPRFDLNIQGNEPWLARLYEDFPVESGPKPVLKGDLRLTSEEGGSILVTGQLSYAPMLGCSRCDKPIGWPLDLKVDVRFYPAGVNEAPREKNLSRAELDAYYIEDAAVDVEVLINDTVQTGLPSRILVTSKDGKACGICKDDLTIDQVYGTPADGGAVKKGDSKPESPFAALKGLKLPK